VKELPSIQLSYFNPKLKKYEDTYTERIPLQVSETERLDTTALVASGASGHSRRELEEVSGGIAANYTGPDVLEPQQPYRTSLACWLSIFIALPVAWCITYAWHRRRLRFLQNPAWRRAQRAYHRACNRLAAIARDETIEGPDEIARTMAGYLADRLNLSAGELTPAEALHHATSLGAPLALGDQLVELLEQCDRARFARRGDRSATEALVRDAHQILTQIDRSAVAGGRRLRTSPMPVVRILLFGSVFLLSHTSAMVTGAEESLDRYACLARASAAFERGTRDEHPAVARQSFREAIKEYELLVADGVENGKLYYNLANAYFRLGEVPRAILYYRLAERLLPRDDQIAGNLAFARSRVVDRVEATETSRLLRQLLAAHTALSVRERMQWAALSLVLGWTLWGARIWVRSRSLTLGGVLVLGMSFGLTASVFLQMNEDKQHPLGVLVADEVLVRKGDGETYEPQFNRPLGSGVEFRVLSRRGEWLHIEMQHGKAGWIRADQAAVADAGRLLATSS
jgi:tetratricopeptide (TPR) repeat protein